MVVHALPAYIWTFLRDSKLGCVKQFRYYVLLSVIKNGKECLMCLYIARIVSFCRFEHNTKGSVLKLSMKSSFFARSVG